MVAVSSGEQASSAPLIALRCAEDGPFDWRATAEALAGWMQVLVVGPLDETTPTVAATQLAAALGAQQRGPVYLCGHDFGGAIALAFAAAFPDRLLGLILVDTTPEPYQPEEDAASDEDATVVAMMRRRSPGFLSRLEFITTPTLVIAGEADAPFFQRGAELLHGWMPFSRLVRIPNAAHRPQVENPAVFAAEVAAFLREMETARNESG